MPDTMSTASVSISTMSQVVNFTGPFAAGQNVTVKTTKVSNSVTLEIPALLSAAGSLIGVATAGAAIPSEFRPTATVVRSATITSNSGLLSAVGLVSIPSSGIITIAADLTGLVNWAVTGNNGWGYCSLTYLL